MKRFAKSNRTNRKKRYTDEDVRRAQAVIDSEGSRGRNRINGRDARRMMRSIDAQARNRVQRPVIVVRGGAHSPPAAAAAAASSAAAYTVSDNNANIGGYVYMRTLPERERAQIPVHHQAINNFYILPKEAIDYLLSDINGEPLINTQTDKINLRQLSVVLHHLTTVARSTAPPQLYVSNETRAADPVWFAQNELKKLLIGANDGTFFPTITETAGGTDLLDIPSYDVRDLPLYLMLFILIELARLPANSDVYIMYSLDVVRGSELRILISDSTGHPIMIDKRDGISMTNLRSIYMAVMRAFAGCVPGARSGNPGYHVTWNGSEDSGTRIRLLRLGRDLHMYLRFFFRQVHSQRRAGVWTQEVEDLLKKTVGTSVISVRNRKDNKCLLYCIVMGLIMKCRPQDDGGKRAFGVSTMMVEDSEVFSKGMHLFQDDSEISQLTRKLARLLIIPSYSIGGFRDPLIQFVEDLDKKAGTMTSITGFRHEFEEIEEKLIPNKICGIDVYGIDYNVNVHVYPLYISKNRNGPVMDLLCVTPKDTDCSHYCLIVNMDKLMKGSGGKQFFSCSKCGMTFYHKRLLNEHKCSAQPSIRNNSAIPGAGGYHYSRKGANPQTDLEVGFCSKCRLCFVNEFEYNYHKKHCFMKGQSGYRHVQLVTYDEKEHPKLTGTELDLAYEDRHVANRRMMYADFESCIDPETGDHHFMSYGIYEWQSDEYKCGYDLQEFFDFILDKAYGNPEEHVYVYFHNAMGYDANFILRHVLKKPEYVTWGIQVIMKSSNRLQKLVFYTRRGDEARIIHIGDTFLFLTLSLERIVGSIRKDNLELNQENFPRFFDVFTRKYPNVTDKDIDHILRKNIFPYKFFTDSSKLDVPIAEFVQIFVPVNENLKFFSERVTLDELRDGYSDTCTVIDRFGCRTARDYHDLYLCCDVMQLADVFDRSMNILWESHHIHLTKYLGMPSASWAAFLRHDPSLSIPLYENTFFAEFFKAMIRGGITSARLRHAVADSSHSIIYLDVNGLYPFVMQQYLYPCGEFIFRPFGWTGSMCAPRLEDKFQELEREQKGMCLCVDLEIPDDVKRKTDMYPFAPEHRQIYAEYYSDVAKKELTPFLKRWSEANQEEKMGAFNGLVCTLYNKKKYNVHWRLLRFYMNHGVRVTKVWFGVEFQEGDYLAGYIRKNIEIRNTRKDELGKTLYKLLGNSIYGKTFESPFKRNTYEIVRDPIKLQGMLEEGNISAMIPIDELGWVIKMDGEDIILDKPTYIGACVVEYAKLHMYTLLYDKLMPMFPGTVDDPGLQLVYTDTDSFIVRVRHPGGQTMQPNELFAYMRTQDPDLIGGIGGQVKSETGEDDTIQEIIALRSKVYAYKTWKGHHDRRAKGTTHDAQELQLDWEAYKQTLESLTSFDTKNVQFVRKTFKVQTLDVFRRSLSVNDGKVYIEPDGIHTHAFGYPGLPIQEIDDQEGESDDENEDDDDDEFESDID